jgi:hypothetical protein
MNRALDKPKDRSLDVNLTVDWDKRVARIREARKQLAREEAGSLP